MQGVGAIIGALMAMKSNDLNLNPYHCFAIYLVLQVIFLIAACMMNSDMEPGEIVESLDGSTNENSLLQNDGERSKWSILKLNFKLIWEAMKNKEILNGILFFVITGCIIPNFEDVQYYFLIDTCHLTKDQYDYLNICQSVGIIFGITAFVFKLKQYDVWKLILASLVFNFVETLLQYANIQRMNLAWGVSDMALNMFLMMIGKATMISLSVLPMTVMMCSVIPKNIEASMFAIVTAAITFSTDWAGDCVGAAVCWFNNISNNDLTHFKGAMEFKILMILASISLVSMLPSNKDIYNLSIKMGAKDTSTEHTAVSFSQRDSVQSNSG